MPNISNKGLSFIEMLVVVGTIGMALPVIFAIIFSILRQQLKLMSLSEIKKQGDYVLTTMQSNIQNNATELYIIDFVQGEQERCDNISSNRIFDHIRSKDPNQAYYFIERPVIPDPTNPALSYNKLVMVTGPSSNSNLDNETDLTNSKVRIVPGSLIIECSRSSKYSTPIIHVRFTIEYNTLSNNPEESSSMTYETSINMKNYQ